MSCGSVPKREVPFEQPSGITLNVGAPTFCGVRRLDAAFELPSVGRIVDLESKWDTSKGVSRASSLPNKPSGITLNVGAPTFYQAPRSGGFRPPSPVVAELQIGRLSLLLNLAGLKSGHSITVAQ